MLRFRYIPIALLLAALLLLCGCSSILERSYSYEVEHISADESSADSRNMQELSTYRELEAALQSAVEEHLFIQTVRLVDYSGEVERDVQRAVHSVMSTPLGDFAVSNISNQISRILSYYEVRFDVSYRRSEPDLEELRFVESPAALENYLTEKMYQFSTGVLVQLSDYSPATYDFSQIYQHIYYSNPRLAYGYRSLEVQLYPDSGNERIAEISIGYTQPQATLAAKSSTATEEAQLILDAYIGSRITANRLVYIHDTLCSTADYDTETAQKVLASEKPLAKTDPFTVYGAIIKGRAVSEGFALAFKQLCDLDGINCLVISGKRDGAPHMWNLVQNRGEWSHIDCTMDGGGDGDPTYAWFGRTDEEMAEHYSWDDRLYPEASSTLLRDILTLEEASEESEETSAEPVIGEAGEAAGADEDAASVPPEDGEPADETETAAGAGETAPEETEESGEEQSPEDGETEPIPAEPPEEEPSDNP